MRRLFKKSAEPPIIEVLIILISVVTLALVVGWPIKILK